MTPQEKFNIIKDLIKNRLKAADISLKGSVSLCSNGLKYQFYHPINYERLNFQDILELANQFDIQISTEKNFIKITSDSLHRSSGQIDQEKKILSWTFNAFYKAYLGKFSPVWIKELGYGSKKIYVNSASEEGINLIIDYLPKINQLSTRFKYIITKDKNSYTFQLTDKNSI